MSSEAKIPVYFLSVQNQAAKTGKQAERHIFRRGSGEKPIRHTVRNFRLLFATPHG
jgi:hypothetical protein